VTSPTTDLEKQGSVSDLDPKRWLALVVIGIAQLMVVLDATIVNIALPDAATALSISPENRQWMVTAYALPFGALLLLGGRIADYLGRKRVLMISLLGFAAASALGGAAQAGWMLFAARALQGVFAAMLAPAALSLLTVTFREAKERAKAFAVFGAIAGGGAAVGLLLGGLLTEYASWRWCLLVNIPIAIVAFIGATAVLKESKNEARGTHYDIPGAILVTAGLGLLVWGFTRAANPDLGWTAPQTLISLGAAVVLLAGFVWRERLSPAPLLPLRILQDRNRAGAYIVGLLVGAGLFAVFLFLTYFLQIVQHYTPIKAGLAFLPFSAGIIVGAGIGSQLVLKIGPRLVVPIGLVMGLIGLLWLSRLNLTSTYSGTVLPAIIVMSVGMGFIFMSTTNVALVGVSKDDAGVASAMVNTTQQVGGSLGTALLSTFALTATTSYIAGHAAELQAAPSAAAKAAIGAAAQVHGYSVAFIVAASFFALATVASLLLINAGKNVVPAEGAMMVA
jgi:EmrB/QacA subfamily drug resistance transporter